MKFTVKHKYIMFLIWLPLSVQAQENPLVIFEPLQDYIWKAEGKWGDGSTFKQEIHLSFALGDKLVKVESNGFTNMEQTEYGPRNHGIRQYDSTLKKIRFWEFDVFGGVTEGFVRADERNLIYEYEYGGTNLTEMWIYKDDTTYDFIVGVLEDGEWKQKYLETQFIGSPR